MGDCVSSVKRGGPAKIRGMPRTCVTLMLTLAVAAAACRGSAPPPSSSSSATPSSAGPRREPGALAPLLEGVGNAHFVVTTSTPRAQQFFDQGLRLSYAFNHAEAERAFKEAQRLDPKLAMAWWGEALV